ncbi:hypothetical protein ACTFIU_008312 [Dictyostelium citrinum]
MYKKGYPFKIVVIGDSGVGKSNIINRFVKNKFENEFITSIGIGFFSKIVYVEDRAINLQIFDIPGHQRFRSSIITQEFRVAHIIIIVFDVTDQKSFDTIPTRLEEVERYANKDVIIIIIGNKCDLITERVVDPFLAKVFTDSLNIILFEASAKQSINIEETFISAAQLCVKQNDGNNKSITTTTTTTTTQKNNCIIN